MNKSIINGIDLSKYFKNHYDSCGRLYCIEYKGNPLELQNAIKRLQEENNILKQAIKNKNFVAIVKENEELKARLKTLDDEVLTIEITPDEFERYKKYKQALEKIRNIAEKLITETPEYHSCYYKDECGNNCTPKKQSKVEYCCYENVDKILTIIDEVLEDSENVENK